MNRDWQFDELGNAGHEHLDADFVRGYDRKQGFPDPTEDVAVFVERGLTSMSTVLDLGAGTGQFALAAAQVFGQVIAVDPSPVMLAELQRKAADDGLSNVECVQAGFLSYDRGAPVDGVFSRNALHQLPDFWKALALDRIAGWLEIDGIFVVRDLIYDFQPSAADAAIEEWLAGAVDDPSRGYTRQDLSEHIRTEHSTFRWLFEPMLQAAGFEIDTVAWRAGVYATYVCTKVRDRGD